ncbi:hypothetical protein EJP617_22220 [Erwinia sp. Ejp617]|nr:hypothetical protein EJP617_22220 [Erwinia sp. Ejp617]
MHSAMTGNARFAPPHLASINQHTQSKSMNSPLAKKQWRKRRSWHKEVGNYFRKKDNQR